MNHNEMRAMRLPVSKIVAGMINEPENREELSQKLESLLADASDDERSYIMDSARVVIWTLEAPGGEVSRACSMFMSDEDIRMEIAGSMGDDENRFLNMVGEQDIDGLAMSGEKFVAGDCALRLENISCANLLERMEPAAPLARM